MPRISTKPVDRSNKEAVTALREDIKSRKVVLSDLNKQAKALTTERKSIEKMIAREASTVEKLQSRFI